MAEIRHDYVQLSQGQRTAAGVIGIGALVGAALAAALLEARWRWTVSTVAALMGLHYLRAAWLGRVRAREDAPAPEWMHRAVERWLPRRWRTDISDDAGR